MLRADSVKHLGKSQQAQGASAHDAGLTGHIQATPAPHQNESLAFDPAKKLRIANVVNTRWDESGAKRLGGWQSSVQLKCSMVYIPK